MLHEFLSIFAKHTQFDHENSRMSMLGKNRLVIRFSTSFTTEPRYIPLLVVTFCLTECQSLSFYSCRPFFMQDIILHCIEMQKRVIITLGQCYIQPQGELYMLHNTCGVSVSHTKIFVQEFDWYDPQDILTLLTSEIAITLLMSTTAPLSQKAGVLWLGMIRTRIICNPCQVSENL